MSNPLVSIVVPVYKAEKYIRRCMDSLVNQTYKNIEIILVDDGSPDNCHAICDEYAERDPRVKVIHKANGGVSSARNVALECLTGEYVLFVDSDDYIELESCETLVEVAERTAADVVVFDYKKIDGEGNESRRVFSNNVIDLPVVETVWSNDEFSKMIMSGRSPVGGYMWNKFCKSQIIQKVRFNDNIKMCEDLLFWANSIDFIKKFVYVPMVLYHYVDNLEGATNNIYLNSADEIRARVECIKILSERFEFLIDMMLYEFTDRSFSFVRSLKNNKNELKKASKWLKKLCFEVCFCSAIPFKVRGLYILMAFSPSLYLTVFSKW